MSIWNPFIWKTAIISSKKPIGQRIRAMLSVFVNLLHEVHRKFGKNCVKTLKIIKFSVFCHFRCQFEIFFFYLENCIYLFIEDYWTTRSCLVERFQHSIARYLLKNWQTLHQNFKKSLKFLQNFSFVGSFFGSFWDPWGQPKKAENLHKYISHEAKFMWVNPYLWVTHLKLNINLVLANFVKNPFDFNIFLSHTKECSKEN